MTSQDCKHHLCTINPDAGDVDGDGARDRRRNDPAHCVDIRRVDSVDSR